PEFAARRGGDNPAEAEVVAADAGIGRVGASGGALGVIFAERHDRETRQLPALALGALQVVDPEVNAIHVANLPRPFPLAAIGRGHALGAFAVVAEREPVPPAQVPEIAVGGRLHLLVARQLAVLRVADDPRALVEVGRDRRVAPAVPI